MGTCEVHAIDKILICGSCKEPLCHSCKHFLMRGKPWCERCIAPYLPEPNSKTRGALLAVAKFWGLLVLTGLVYLLMPAAKIGAAVIFASAYLWFVIFRDFGEEKMVIEEVAGGTKKQIAP
jgi:hypothetical protein